MNRRRGTLAGSPLLIGAVTVLIVAVAVFISYNAITGLPFEPTYKIGVELPNASNLQKGNEVKLGGSRVGIVEKLVPKQNPKTGKLTAIALLKLKKSVGPLPKNTKAIVQSVSSVGLKYLLLERGSGSKMLREGATIPVSQTREPVDIDQFFDTFDKATRRANKVNLSSFGDGLAGRGVGLNETLGELLPLVDKLTPVMHNLASSKTDLKNFFASLDRAAREVAPVAGAQARLYSDLDTFFGAWAGAARGLEESIKGGPSSLRQAIHSLPAEAPFVDNSTEFMRLLRPSAKLLRSVAAPFAHALGTGAVNLKRAQSLNGELASSAEATHDFADNPAVELGLEDLTGTAKLGNPLVATLVPLQEKCNYITLLFRNVASLFSESIGVGTLARVETILPPSGANNEGYPASAPANGPSTEHTRTGELVDNDHLHYDPYPDAATCEAGKEEYAQGRAVIGKASSTSSTNTEETFREDNVYGEEDSAATLKDLGIKKKQSKEGEASAEGEESKTSGKSKKSAKSKGGRK